MDLIHKSDKEIMQVVTPIMDNLMEASTENDYEKHILNHTERAKNTISKEQLEEMCKSYQAEFGIFTDRELMGIARHHNYINVVWKQKMSKSQDEFLAILCLVQDGERYLVDRCWVDLWQPQS
jgi:hypothetical protein